MLKKIKTYFNTRSITKKATDYLYKCIMNDHDTNTEYSHVLEKINMKSCRMADRRIVVSDPSKESDKYYIYVTCTCMSNGQYTFNLYQNGNIEVPFTEFYNYVHDRLVFIVEDARAMVRNDLGYNL